MIASITKKALQKNHVGKWEWSEECYSEEDSGLRLSYGDEDNYYLGGLTNYELISLEQALTLCPEAKKTR